MDEALKRLQINLKNFPWRHYPAYKVEKNDALDILNALEKLEESEKEVRDEQ